MSNVAECDNILKEKINTGSCEYQVAGLTKVIVKLTDHLKTHPKDQHNKRMMMKKINLRKKLLAYLKRKEHERYQALIKALNLRR